MSRCCEYHFRVLEPRRSSMAGRSRRIGSRLPRGWRWCSWRLVRSRRRSSSREEDVVEEMRHGQIGVEEAGRRRFPSPVAAAATSRASWLSRERRARSPRAICGLFFFLVATSKLIQRFPVIASYVGESNRFGDFVGRPTVSAGREATVPPARTQDGG
jgi:hypothetical protein